MCVVPFGVCVFVRLWYHLEPKLKKKGGVLKGLMGVGAAGAELKNGTGTVTTRVKR